MRRVTSRLAAIVIVGLIGGCASAPEPRQFGDSQTSLTVFATTTEAIEAATTALAEKRLGSATIENIENGVVVRGELSGLQGAIYNSHGGWGRVKILAAFPGSKRQTISAVTQSRLTNEPVGPMDALKGYNYNDIKYAVEIIHRIGELLPQRDIAQLSAEDDRARQRWEDSEREKIASAKAKRDREEAEEAARRAKDREFEDALIADAARGSRFVCLTDSDCRKAFSLAQIFVSTKTDMKIQLATDTIIETYNPTETGKIGAKVIKMPGVGQSAEIVISISCKDCPKSRRWDSLSVTKEFRPYIEARMK